MTATVRARGVALAAAGALALGAALVGVSSSAGASEESSSEPVTFTVAFLNDADSLNPFTGYEATSYEFWALMYDYMIGYRPSDMAPVPTGLAEDWENSEDGLTWTFTIREGVTFHDGEPLTAADIAYTYNRVLDGGPEAVNYGSYLGSVEKITAPDDTTVVLELSEPNAVLPLLPIPIMPEHVWSKISEEEVKSFANEPPGVVGSGPFEIVEGKAGASLYRFKANEDYWQGAPNIDEAIFRVFNNEDLAVQALKTGEVDFVEDIKVSSAEALENEETITTNNGVSPSFEEIAFNTGAIDTDTGEPIGDGHPALLDPEFRRALAYAVDNDAIVDRVYDGAGEPGVSIIPPFYETYYWPPDEAYEFNLDTANQMLDEAGYERGADGIRTMPDSGDPISLRLHARSESEYSKETMEFFAEWLADVGIESEVMLAESGKLTNLILDGEFDVFQWGWYVEPDPDSILEVMTCDARGGSSDSWYCNEEYDRLYTQQHSEVDEAKRAEMVMRMQEILYEDVPYIVTAYTSIIEAYRSDRFTGFVPQPDGGVLLVQYGVENYLNIEPVTGASSSSDDEGLSGAVIGGIVAGGVGLAVLGVVLFARRRDTATAEDRE